MIPKFKPMLAAPLLGPHIEHTDENILKAMQQLRYPVIASPKLDGIRALRLNGTLLSRKLKPIPNKSIRERSMIIPGGIDCELFNWAMGYNEIESIVMSQEHKDSNKIRFHILDRWISNTGYEERLTKCKYPAVPFDKSIENPAHIVCYIPNALLNVFLNYEQHGYEGICFRTPNSPYKFGRSTLREQYLVKLSRYERCEVKIIGFEEQMENSNKEEIDNLGHTKRGSQIEGMIPKDTLGALVCEHPTVGEVRIGTGFDNQLRKHIWDTKQIYLGRCITIKYKPHGGKDKLRHPVFIGFRNDL